MRLNRLFLAGGAALLLFSLSGCHWFWARRAPVRRGPRKTVHKVRPRTHSPDIRVEVK